MKVRMWTFRRLSSSCVYLVMYFTSERQVTFSYGFRIIVFIISPYVDDLTVFYDLIWVDQCSFIFLWSICSSHGISFVLPTLFFVHIDLHSLFNIFHTSFLYIPSTVRCSSFLLFHHWYIYLGLFLPHRYEYIGCSKIHGLWDSLHILHFIHEGMIFYHWVFEPSFPSFLHLITLAYIMSRVLRPHWGHDITHYV